MHHQPEAEKPTLFLVTAFAYLLYLTSLICLSNPLLRDCYRPPLTGNVHSSEAQSLGCVNPNLLSMTSNPIYPDLTSNFQISGEEKHQNITLKNFCLNISPGNHAKLFSRFSFPIIKQD